VSLCSLLDHQFLDLGGSGRFGKGDGDYPVQISDLGLGSRITVEW